MGARYPPHSDMEMVDVINEANEIISQASKEDAHTKGLLHRCVIAEVKNSRGEWLLVKQSATRQDAGQFVSPVGGHVQAGESPDHAIMRETMEELGIIPSICKYVGSKIFNRTTRNKQENHLFILFEIISDDMPVLNDESDSFEYFSEERIQKTSQSQSEIFGEAFTFILREFYPHLI